MSWAARYNLEENGDLVKDFESGLGSPEADMQHDACLLAFADIMESGAVGDYRKYTYSLTLSGHANENHEPAPGWANDQISFVLAQTGLREENK